MEIKIDYAEKFGYVAFKTNGKRETKKNYPTKDGLTDAFCDIVTDDRFNSEGITTTFSERATTELGDFKKNLDELVRKHNFKIAVGVVRT